MLLCSIKFVEIPLDFVDYCSYFVVLLRLNNAKTKFLLSIYKYIASSLIFLGITYHTKALPKCSWLMASALFLFLGGRGWKTTTPKTLKTTGPITMKFSPDVKSYREARNQKQICHNSSGL